MKKFKLQTNRGMTYVELIVVLSIFSVMSAVVMYNYGAFQGKVDIKNLANDLALKMVQAQRDASYGKFPSLAQQGSIAPTWKPAYGIYFDLPVDNKSFYYFSDLNNDKLYQGTNCTGECVEKISITKNNIISLLRVVYQDGSSSTPTKMTVSFTRPNLNSEVVVDAGTTPLANVSYVEISTTSPKGNIAKILIYASGRIQIN
ncbi:MAG TPA: type II secretion system protein [Candidatus Paceibacterota bacterium]